MDVNEKRFKRMLEKSREWTVRTLIGKTAWELQKAIRMESADEFGMCVCVSCGAKKHYKDCHAGHFVASRCNAILFDERGINPQCVRCNTYLGGNQEGYTKYMLDNHGQEVIDELNQLRNTTVKFEREELIGMRICYMDRIKVQKQRLSEGLA